MYESLKNKISEQAELYNNGRIKIDEEKVLEDTFRIKEKYDIKMTDEDIAYLVCQKEINKQLFYREKDSEIERGTKAWRDTEYNLKDQGELIDFKDDIEKIIAGEIGLLYIESYFKKEENFKNYANDTRELINYIHEINPNNNFDLILDDSTVILENNSFKLGSEYGVHAFKGENLGEVTLFPERTILSTIDIKQRSGISNMNAGDFILTVYMHEAGHAKSTKKMELVDKANEYFVTGKNDMSNYYFEILAEIDAWKEGRDVLKDFIKYHEEEAKKEGKEFNREKFDILEETYEKYNKWQTEARLVKIVDPDIKIDAIREIRKTYQEYEKTKEARVEKDNGFSL